jgi:hypothetical protein
MTREAKMPVPIAAENFNAELCFIAPAHGLGSVNPIPWNPK